MSFPSLSRTLSNLPSETGSLDGVAMTKGGVGSATATWSAAWLHGIVADSSIVPSPKISSNAPSKEQFMRRNFGGLPLEGELELRFDDDGVTVEEETIGL